MKLSLELTLGLLAVSCVDAFVVPPRTIWATKAALASRSYRAHPVRHDADFQSLESLTNAGSRRREAQKQGGGLMIGGLTLGGPGGGITGDGLKLGGSQKGNGTATAAEAPKSSATKGEKPAAAKGGKPAAEGEKPAAAEEGKPATEGEKSPATEEQKPKESEAGAGAGTENQPGRAEGEAAKKEAEREAQEAKGEKSNGVKATEESEKFSEESGITLGQDGNADNLGGNLGITQGSDGMETFCQAPWTLLYGSRRSDFSSSAHHTTHICVKLGQWFKNNLAYAGSGGETGSESEEERDLFRLRLKQSIEDRKSYDLKLDVKRLQIAVEAVQALNRNLEQAQAFAAITTSETEALRAQVGTLKDTIREKDAKLARATNDAAREASHTRAQLHRLQNAHDRVTADTDALKRDLEEARTQSKVASNSQARLIDLERKFAAEQDKVVQLTNEKEAELKLVQEKLTLAESSQDCHRAEHTQMPGVRNTINASRAPEIDRLKNEVTKLRNEINDKKAQVLLLKRDIAYYVTHLDLAYKDCRVYTCSHDHLNNIVNDGQNMTCRKDAGLVADEFFADWENDKDFMVEYNSVRQHILNHHRAHESMKRGRGDASGWIRNEFNEDDRRRRVNVTYR